MVVVVTIDGRGGVGISMAVVLSLWCRLRRGKS